MQGQVVRARFRFRVIPSVRIQGQVRGKGQAEIG